MLAGRAGEHAGDAAARELRPLILNAQAQLALEILEVDRLVEYIRQDVDAVIESLAKNSKISPKAMAKRISRNGRLNDLFLNIRESKTIDFIATQMEQKPKQESPERTGRS